MNISKHIAHLSMQFKRLVNDFSRCERGTVVVIFALSMVPLLLGIGTAVDMGRAYIVKQRLLEAADAAGLAIASAIDENSTNAELQIILDNFMAANFPATDLGTLNATSFTYANSIITVNAAVKVDTVFMKLAQINDMNVAVTSQVTRSQHTLEVVLVLDNSGSMAGSKLTALKSASDGLVDILFGDSQASPQVKIGLVPFSNNVNIGSANTSYVSSTAVFDWGPSSWKGCIEAVTTGDEDTKDDYLGPWTPFYWPDDSNNNWYYSDGYHISSSKGPNLYCPDAPITPLTNNKSTLTSAISNMVANGGTHINLGAIWGWRAISPSEPFDQGVAYNTVDNTKAVIILTDGANTAYSYVYDAFGYPSEARLGYGIDTASEVATEIDNRLSTICTNMKNQGIILYTITFDVTDSSTKNLFEVCATDSEKYYNSPSNDELTRSFRSIAAELKKLHVIH